MPLNDETRKSINQDVISIMKDGVRILNFSRGELVDDDAVISACENGKIACYVTDFPNEKMIGKNPSPIPHLGAPQKAKKAVPGGSRLRSIWKTALSTRLIFQAVLWSITPIRFCITHRNVPAC